MSKVNMSHLEVEMVMENMLEEVEKTVLKKGVQIRACLKNHSCNLHASICGIFCLHSVDVARYAALIQAKSPTNCNAHLTESIFQTRSRGFFKHTLEF